MILKSNRHFAKAPPSKDAKCFYIFCEGKHREPKYFQYFAGINSRIKVEVIPAEHEGDNSPLGLYSKACELILSSAEKPNPKFELLPIDEVWFVIDTDDWGGKIAALREKCAQHTNWHIAQSNPCFEVWLYFHFEEQLATFEGKEISKNWKSTVNDIAKGGFDHRKHPVFLAKAIDAARNNFSTQDGIPNLCCTEVFRLGENIYSLTEQTLNDRLANMQNS